MPGFPIQTPWDHSSVDSSPRPIAASHVFHRLLVPRHPPCALSNLTTKMLASTMQFSTNAHPHPPTCGEPPPGRLSRNRGMTVIRCIQKKPHPGPKPTGGLFLQDPTGCLHPIPAAPHPPFPTTPHEVAVLGIGGRCRDRTRQCLRHRAPRHHIRAARAPYRLSADGAP